MEHSLEKTIQRYASQCVKCGLCLPHCPTYAVTENECESPRGRIAIMDALAKKQIPLSAKTQVYLDHCLTCRACEAVCPAQVQYGQLIDAGRRLIAEAKPQANPASLSKLLTLACRHPWLWRISARLAAFYQQSGLQFALRKSGLLNPLGLKRADALLPAKISAAGWRNYYPAQSAEKGRIALFTGCVNQFIDQATIKAAIYVLTAYGYSVHVPAAQRCCGALHQHAGLTPAAKQLAAKNIEAFNALNPDNIITITTGCAATLQEYARLNPGAQAQMFSEKIADINQFLLNDALPTPFMLKECVRRAVLHTPCTLRNVLKQAAAPLQLLQKIPALEIIELNNPYCCGAAGQYMLQYPDMADTLLNKTLAPILALNPDYLLTTNIGCALHLQKGLAENGCKTAVLHPIVLIARQLSISNTL